MQALCNASGELDAVSFERVIRRQLQLFIQVICKIISSSLLVFLSLCEVKCLLCYQRTLAASLEQIERLEPAPGSAQEHMGVALFVLKVFPCFRSEEPMKGLPCLTDLVYGVDSFQLFEII